MKYTRENIVEGINAKLDEMYGKDPMLVGACALYKSILPDYPIEIEQNVLEWVNGAPLTDIDCHGVSIKRIMENRNLKEWYFPVVLRNFIMFKRNDFEGGNYLCYEGL